MKATKFLALAAAAFVFTACNNEESPAIDTGEPVALKIIGNIGAAQTRAYDSQWDTNDEIGVYAIGDQTNYINKRYVHKGSGNFEYVNGAASGIFFQNNQPVIIYAYYPFNGSEGMAPNIQSVTKEQSDQKSYDFLFVATRGVTNRNNPVQLNFAHKMSRLILKITTDEDYGFSAGDVTKGTYYLSGLKLQGEFNTTTGTARATGEVTNDWEINATPSDIENVRTYSMIFFPQSTSGITFKAVINGTAYTCQLPGTGLEGGKSYTYNITVKKTGLSVSGCTITSWTEVEGGSGSAVIE